MPPRRPLDAYYTPPAVARACVAALPCLAGATVLEPHAGGGSFVRALGSAGALVTACDVNPAAPGLALAQSSWVGDFLGYQPPAAPAWVIGNPPYCAAESHVRHALQVTGRHVVYLLRLAFLESIRRAPLWRAHPPRRVWVLSARPSFTGGGTDSAAYGWMWWDAEHRGPPTLGWLDWSAQGDQLELW